MNTPTKETLRASSPKVAALWVFSTDPDLVNPYDKTDPRHYEFAKEIFDLECAR